ncbi:MAG: S41 family peptidase [Armatimonadetes bacterium]|nr:S41 family peptidase [Armatimonadota bacterium]
MQRRRISTVLLAICVGASFFLGLFFQDVFAQGGLPEWAQGPRLGTGEQQLTPVQTYHRVLQDLKAKFAGDLPADIKLTYGAIRGLMHSLDDPYTRFLDPEEYKELRQENEGEFVGIGAALDPEPTKEGYIRINRPYPDTPAAAAGLHAGDFITKVDGKSVVGLTVEQVVQRIRGQANTPVRLTILRPGGQKSFDVAIVRQPVEYPVVEYEMKDGQVGYVSLMQFNEMADSKLERAIRDLERQGMKGLILDLRGNPGGMLESAVDVSSRFVPPDRPVVIIVESGGQREERRARASKYLGGKYPLVLLLNRHSASASEIVAGAIKDHGTGTLIGETTFGKGLVQQVVPLSDGSALMVTTAKYLSPKGTEINRGSDYRGGVAPDIEVDSSATDERTKGPQFERALSFLREKLKLSAPAGATASAAPAPAH